MAVAAKGLLQVVQEEAHLKTWSVGRGPAGMVVEVLGHQQQCQSQCGSARLQQHTRCCDMHSGQLGIKLFRVQVRAAGVLIKQHHWCAGGHRASFPFRMAAAKWTPPLAVPVNIKALGAGQRESVPGLVL